MAWFDAGINLLDPRFEQEAVIERALNAGVNKLCVITTNPSEWDSAQSLYQRYPDNLCYTLGVHPHYAKDVGSGDLSKLREIAHADGVVAIGECGLDFNRNFSPQEVQVDVFRQQLSIANEVKLPVYLHERDAFEQQSQCLSEIPPQFGGIAHCFTGTKEQLNHYVNQGLYVGITGWLCDEKRGESLRDAIGSLPLERLMLETDGPYLFPKTLRPRKRNNEPCNIPHIGEKVASLLGVAPKVIMELSYDNACRLFKILD